MVITKEQSATDNSGNVTSSTTSDATSGTTKSCTTSSTASSTTRSGTTKSSAKKKTRRRTARKSGAERLRSAADRRVGQNAKRLADLLTEKALAGELAYAKVLVGLADGKKAEPKNRRWLSMIEELATEPEWVEPVRQ